MNKAILILVKMTAVFVCSTSCNMPKKNADKQIFSQTTIDTLNHGYNELANPDKRKLFAISDYNTDNFEVKNIKRPSVSTIKTQLDTSALYEIWTSNPDGPHADFVFSDKSYFVVDYDGDGDMPYELIDRKLRIYYNDFIQDGEIVSVTKDTLKIKWKDFDKINSYVRWAH